MRGVHLYTLPDMKNVSAYEKVYNAFNTKPSDVVGGYYETMLDALESLGSLATCDLFQFFSAHNQVDSLINWARPGTFDPAEVSGPLWEQYKGFTCALTPRGYVRCNYNPASDAIHYSLNSATVIVGTATTDEDTSEFGANDGSSIETRINGLATGSNVTASINAAFSNSTPTILNGIGYFGATRNNATQIKIWQNIGSTIVSQNSVSVTDREFYATTANIGATNPEYMERQQRFVWAGGYLTDAKYIATITAIEACLDSLSTGLIT